MTWTDWFNGALLFAVAFNLIAGALNWLQLRRWRRLNRMLFDICTSALGQPAYRRGLLRVMVKNGQVSVGPVVRMPADD
jgi:hypothetical protein